MKEGGRTVWEEAECRRRELEIIMEGECDQNALYTFMEMS
jgi:hypothetical protein